ncbi:unnamed protein product [Prunus armeniaca]|uniref:Uncharacterized protein n=1 Tax=Prunus armeniaca TaxID=36596 RepID=A0A6J5WTM7_PRUAR|nr:unnamed protein product [Prunus armeniaca]
MAMARTRKLTRIADTGGEEERIRGGEGTGRSGIRKVAEESGTRGLRGFLKKLR